MSPDLQAKIYAKYPDIFRDRNKSARESCMHWGLEIGDGWYDLIDKLCRALSNTYSTGFMIGDEYVNIQPPQVIADQTKSKYASLRFYYHLQFDDAFVELAYGDNPNLEACKIADRYSVYYDGIVHMAESMSEITCEVTGKSGMLCVRGGWLKTLCPEEAEKQGYKPYAIPEESK